jgi:hypothetical protein
MGINNSPQGLKPSASLGHLAARLKPCPSTKHESEDYGVPGRAQARNQWHPAFNKSGELACGALRRRWRVGKLAGKFLFRTHRSTVNEVEWVG